jgi:hypothetical protein
VKQQYCSDFSISLEEPMGGTAGHAKHFFFITWPKAKWGQKVFKDSQGEWTSKYLEWVDSQAEIHGGILTRLIQHPENNYSEGLKIYAYPGAVLYENISPEKVLEILEYHLKGLRNHTLSHRISSNRQLSVCTHGRHDKCCAKFGQQLFDTLRESINESDHTIEIWESSHLGGHRFAATVLDMPSGKMYGRIKPNLIDALLNEKVQIEFHRGNVFNPAWLQVVELEIQKYLKDQKLRGEVKITKEVFPTKDSFEAYFHLRDNQETNWKMKLRRQEFGGPNSCEDLYADKPRLLWVKDNIEEIRIDH